MPQPSKMPLRAQDLLQHLTNDQPSITYCYMVTFMLQPSKMQGKPEIAEKRRFGASRAILRTAHAGSACKFDQLFTTYHYT